MDFTQFNLESLGHASYLIGSEDTGDALVLDPRRDVDVYLEAARRKGLRIRYVVDSHGHNDYLSGLSEVAARTGAEVLAYADADAGYPHRAVKDRQVLELGEVGIEVLHTPGHTPEHVSLLLCDRSEGDDPVILLSGGALLVGDVARPDLLGSEEETRRSARQLCQTLRERILSLPDHVQVFPTHVAGSLCGGDINSRLSTTVGYERRTNRVLRALADGQDDDGCIDLAGLPSVPPYWRRMRSRNLAGVERLGVLGEPPAVDVEELKRLRDHGAVVLDARAPEAFGGGHIAGALNVGLGSSFPTWAGTVLPGDARVLLVVDRPDDLWEVTWHLLRIGYGLPVGWLAGGIQAWRTAAEPLERFDQITVQELRAGLDGRTVDLLDVRQPDEWRSGHAPQATFITGAELPGRLDDVPDTGRPLAVVCGSGYRSSVSASLLARHGRHVVNVLGGMTAWKAAGYPTQEDRREDGS
jgi:hydroxyacylglutathione hydrolase